MKCFHLDDLKLCQNRAKKWQVSSWCEMSVFHLRPLGLCFLSPVKWGIWTRIATLSPGALIIWDVCLSNYTLVADCSTLWGKSMNKVWVTNSWSSLKFMPIKSMMPNNHLFLCHPLLHMPSIFPSIRVFSNESSLHIRWPNIGVSASTSVLPMNTSFEVFMNRWTDLL